MKRKLIPIILLVAVAAGAGYFFTHRAAKDAGATSVTLSGNIEAHESVLGFKVPGRLTELPVEEGELVKAGDILARLDQSDYRQQVQIDEAGVGTRQAELGLATAGSRPQEKKAAHQSVLDAQADYELKKHDLQRYQALYEKDEVSAQVRDTASAALKRSQAALERAKQNYDQVLEGVRKEQVEINRAAVRSARQALELSRIKLSYTTLQAPISGVVLVRQAELGEVLAAGAPVVTIADLDHLWMRGYLSETDLGRVKLGQVATVKTDTYPGKSYRGRVSFISSQAEFTPKSVETHKERVTLVYRIKIELENPGHELKPGMPADATFSVAPAR
ncbi:efflux RND transporter periplasmic adaptor subunit [Geomonas subterranea]|uniref:Efflux RND transporter periplasmic adaptor subunit n=1 Tax=Geomonas subterranea TaxID=2847989 RepID=A0ABX8LE83_9BACT|nr:efflux RND transporter periplasmic adaptor subunit [Geomonas subterranea]QXE89636.1 efflux RND transporter periplasmic adaptor subunit [Geomonas subterranea]QXM08248.1 efflux RND transporter periplasmic adaptor subunit [Geomonas subterranea]